MGGVSETDLAADRHWEAWRDWARDNGLAVPSDPGWHAAWRCVWQGSEYVAKTCAPEVLAELLRAGELGRRLGAGEIARQLAAELADLVDESSLMSALRRFRRRHQVRIIWRDLAGWADLDETREDLSELANERDPNCHGQGSAGRTLWLTASAFSPCCIGAS